MVCQHEEVLEVCSWFPWPWSDDDGHELEDGSWVLENDILVLEEELCS